MSLTDFCIVLNKYNHSMGKRYFTVMVQARITYSNIENHRKKPTPKNPTSLTKAVACASMSVGWCI